MLVPDKSPSPFRYCLPCSCQEAGFRCCMIIYRKYRMLAFQYSKSIFSDWVNRTWKNRCREYVVCVIHDKGHETMKTMEYWNETFLHLPYLAKLFPSTFWVHTNGKFSQNIWRHILKRENTLSCVCTIWNLGRISKSWANLLRYSFWATAYRILHSKRLG